MSVIIDLITQIYPFPAANSFYIFIIEVVKPKTGIHYIYLFTVNFKPEDLIFFIHPSYSLCKAYFPERNNRGTDVCVMISMMIIPKTIS